MIDIAKRRAELKAATVNIPQARYDTIFVGILGHLDFDLALAAYGSAALADNDQEV